MPTTSTETMALDVEDFRRLGVRTNEFRLSVIRSAAARSSRSLAEQQLLTPSDQVELQLSRVVTSAYRLMDPRLRANPHQRAHVGRILPNTLDAAGRTRFSEDLQASGSVIVDGPITFSPDTAFEPNLGAASTLHPSFETSSDDDDDVADEMWRISLSEDDLLSTSLLTRKFRRVRQRLLGSWVVFSIGGLLIGSVLGIFSLRRGITFVLVPSSAAVAPSVNRPSNELASAKNASNVPLEVAVTEPQVTEDEASTASEDRPVQSPPVQSSPVQSSPVQPQPIQPLPIGVMIAKPDATTLEVSESPDMAAIDGQTAELAEAEAEAEVALQSEGSQSWAGPSTATVNVDGEASLRDEFLPDPFANPDSFSGPEPFLGPDPLADLDASEDDLIAMETEMESPPSQSFEPQSFEPQSFEPQTPEPIKPITEVVNQDQAIFDVFLQTQSTLVLPDQHDQFLREGVILFERAIASDSLGAAGAVHVAMQKSLPLASSASLAGVIKQNADTLKICQRLSETYRSVLEREGGVPLMDASLDEAPSLGRYLCLMQRNWEVGLKFLDRSTDPKIASVARQELLLHQQSISESVPIKEWLVVAQRWEKVAEREEGRTQDSLRLHAFEILSEIEKTAEGIERLEASRMIESLRNLLPAHLIDPASI